LRDEALERGIVAALATLSQADPAKASEWSADWALGVEHFGDPAAGAVFAAVRERVSAGRAADLDTLAPLLRVAAPVRAKPRGWLESVLASPDVARRPELLERAKRVRALAQRRRAVELAKRLETCARDVSVPMGDALDAVGEGLEALSRDSGGARSAADDVVATLEELNGATHSGRGLAIRTGVEPLDAAIGGLQPGVVTALGALPGVGKSALIATIVDNLTARDVRVGVLSLEDNARWLVRRILASRSSVSVFAMGTRPLSDEELGRLHDRGRGVYSQLRNLFVDDREGLTVDEAKRSALDMVRRNGCRVILLDHLGEVDLAPGDRQDLELLRAFRAMRAVAKGEEIPVLVASHLKRRDGLSVTTAPELQDFAGGSACERASRVALGLSKVKGDNRGIRVSVLKQTSGPAGMDLVLDLNLTSAMVSNGGRT
jgi:replicative DNA helicase